jgi:hypothetical protein
MLPLNFSCESLLIQKSRQYRQFRTKVNPDWYAVSCREWPRLTRRIAGSGETNLPVWRFGMEQTSTLDPSYCYTVKELAFLWNMSPESIRRMFVNEPGTLVFRMQATGRRTYRNVRIPGKVALRVQNRMTVVAPVTRPAYGR